MKFEKKKIFDEVIFMEEGMGSPYRIDNLVPILFLKIIPRKLGWKEISLC